jgi:hypothetical protein
MKLSPSGKTLWLGIGLIVLGLAGLSFFRMTASFGPAPFSGWGSGGFYDRGSYISNGERIYYLGIDGEGRRIRTRGGPHWLYRMGGSCVNCHGPDGRGGFPVMMGTEVPSDIRFASLVSDEHSHVEEGTNGRRYTEESIKKAITQGVEPDGERLDPTMPRFDMTDKDIDDLIGFLKTLN